MDMVLPVINTKQLRKDIDEVLQRIKNLEFRYETANAITKFQNGTELDIDYNLVQIGNKSFSDYITEHINMDTFEKFLKE